ncbi:MAG TPA: AI-2E family transporter [Dehalococcoidia bacterium]|jgi:predicted PurR-regulated permease PerM|nr:AI-2E family transporter [Dehalococcoidia bacterium]
MLKVEVSARGAIIVALILLAILAAKELLPVLLLVLISLILMVGLLPYVDAMVRKGIPRVGAVLILLFVFFAALIALFGIMIPAIVEEVEAIRENLPESAREIEDLLRNFGIHVELQERARNIDWDRVISGRAAIDYGQRVVGLILSIVTIIVMTAYLLTDTPRLGNFVTQFIPPERRPELERLFWSLTRVVGGFLRGQAITSLSIAVFTFIVLRIVGVPNALAFAVLAAFADVIPLVGALIATVPPVAAALQESSTQALIVLFLLLGYQQFEDRLLVPRVYGRTLNLPPVIVLIAVLSGAELLGITGVLLALPLTAAGRVALDYVLENRSWLLADLTDQPFAPDLEEPEVDGAEVEQGALEQNGADASTQSQTTEAAEESS